MSDIPYQMSKNKSTKTVLASGVFDGLHPGHEYFLHEAKQHGNTLVVVVTSDGHAERTKRVPANLAADRVSAVAALPLVDEAFVGSDPYDLKATLDRAQPDVIALGHDQPIEPGELAAEANARGHDVAVVRIGKQP